MNNKLFTNSARIISVSLLVSVSTVLTGCMSIHTAARNGNLTEVKKQLAWGVNPNTRTFWYLNTPLHGAASYGRIKVVKLLLAKGTDVNKGNEGGERPLHYAARHGHTKVMKILLENGAKVSEKGTGCGTPLRWAAENGQIEAAELLLAYGADIDQENGSALRVALENRQLEMVKFLISKGADVNARSATCTALYSAYRGGYVEIARILLEHGADPALECNGRRISDEFLKTMQRQSQ